jgi:hypothetical protein
MASNGAGGLSYFSSGPFGSDLGGSVWLEATAVSKKEIAELSETSRSMPDLIILVIQVPRDGYRKIFFEMQ